MGVATTIAVGSTLASAGMSFAQANKQQRLMRDAQASADKAMQEARKKLEVNVFAAQGLNKEPYEKQREALLSTGAQAIQAGVESERGSAATAGRVLMAENEAQAQQAAEMNKDLMMLNQQTLEEQSRLNDLGIQLDLGEVQGAQTAAANYADMAAASQNQAYQGLANAAAMGAGAIDQGKSSATKAYDKLSAQANKQGVNLQSAVSKLPNSSNVSGLSNDDFKALMIGRGSDYIKSLYGTGTGITAPPSTMSYAKYLNPFYYIK